MGHIALSRAADLVVVAPATADLMAKLASGLTPTTLPRTALLATDKPVLMAPAMNVRMWEHPATRRNLAALRRDGRACSSAPTKARWPAANSARAAWPSPARSWPRSSLAAWRAGPLKGFRALVTAGPTHEPIDPVRFLANRSSGKQGYAIADALARAGADTVLVSGPVSLPTPHGVRLVRVDNGARNAGGLRSRTARRCRGLRRGRRRLACRDPHQQTQESRMRPLH